MKVPEAANKQMDLVKRLPANQPIAVRALNLGERLHLRGLYETPLEYSPLVQPVGERGLAMLFRYGVVVLFNVTDTEQKVYLKELKERIDKPYRRHESEDAQVVVSAQTEGVSAEGINITALTLPRLQVVATVLARSVSLAYFELAMAAAFDAVEPLARKLDQPRASSGALKELLRHIGNTLLVQQKMIGRVEIEDKPDILWDQPELERLYARLDDEYELRERLATLERKLELIERTAETTLDLVQSRRMLRVEWYIVGLIVFEVLLTLYEMWWKR
jgi:required for meiotic nuclear division protein 1